MPEEKIQNKSVESLTNEQVNKNTDQDTEKVITEQPKPTHLEPPDEPEGSDESSSITVSEVGSGYQDDSNECNEFCLEFCTCFGLFSTCCPSTGEGFVTSFANFCGTFIVSCIKC